MNLVDLTDDLINYMRGTITSPHASNINWIYSDYPRNDVTFPRISITQIAGSLSEIGIGETTESGKTGNLASVDFDIDIWVKTNDKMTVSGVTYSGTKLREYLADLIILRLESAKYYFKSTYEILDIEIFSIASVPLDEENMLQRKTIGIRCTFILEDS